MSVHLEQWQLDNLARLMAVLGPRAAVLTPAELSTLQWLSGWDDAVIDNLVSILRKQAQEIG